MKYFKHSDFKLTGLIALKESKRVTIGLGIPVLNEAATILNTIEVARSCHKLGLIDDYVFVDSGSTDGSDVMCEAAGVRCIRGKDVAEEYGLEYATGKGWNLWSSVLKLDTDIVVWIDADITNLSEDFIIGLVGPMIQDDEVVFVKGFYDRPEGARVTELVARPFINLFYPEAAAFIQPLSGEYGGRRTFLEKITFYSGYSVEIAILLQASKLLKPDNIAQVNLDQRIHQKTQGLLPLSKMSFEILTTALHLAEKDGLLKVRGALNHTLASFITKGSDSPEEIHYRQSDTPLPLINALKRKL